jgi:hypothetical protein
MHIISRIIEEIPNNFIINLLIVHFGRKIKILKVYNKQAVLKE